MNKKIIVGTWSWGSGIVEDNQVFGNHFGEKELYCENSMV